MYVAKKCNDCRKPLDEAETGPVIKFALKIGKYYDGPPICDSCGQIKYEEAVANFKVSLRWLEIILINEN